MGAAPEKSRMSEADDLEWERRAKEKRVLDRGDRVEIACGDAQFTSRWTLYMSFI